MARSRRKITPQIEALILERSAAGLSGRDLKALLKKRFKVDLSHVAIGNVVRERRSERADIAKVKTREHIGKTLPADLQRFDVRINRLLREVRKVEKAIAKVSPRSSAYGPLANRLKQLGDQYRRMVEAKLHYVGADQPDEKIDGLAGLLGLAMPS